MKVAIVIVNYNDVEDTVKYVNTISKYNVINRVVVVDNLSTTSGAFETLKKLEDEKVYVIQSDKNGGYDYGNNIGIKYLESKGEEYDYIIVSNPDISVSEEAINSCLEKIEKDDKIAVIAPRMFNKDNKPIRRSAWKMRTFWLDVVHSTRVLELLFYKVLRNGEYNENDYKKEMAASPFQNRKYSWKFVPVRPYDGSAYNGVNWYVNSGTFFNFLKSTSIS